MTRRRIASSVAALSGGVAILLAGCTGGSDHDASDNDPPASLPAGDEPAGSSTGTSPTPSASPTPSGPQLPAESYLPAPSVGDRWVYSLTSAASSAQTITDTETVTSVVRDGATQVLTLRRVLTYDDGSQPDVQVEGSYVLGDDGSLTIRFSPQGPAESSAGIASGEIAIPAWAALQAAPASGSVATGGFVSTTVAWTVSSVGTTRVQVPAGSYTARVVGVELLGAGTGLVRTVLYTADGVGPVRVEVQAAGRIVTVAQLLEYAPA